MLINTNLKYLIFIHDILSYVNVDLLAPFVLVKPLAIHISQQQCKKVFHFCRFESLLVLHFSLKFLH